MFDTSFHFKGERLDGLKVYEDGLKLADTWLERQKNAELANIKRQTQNILDPESRFAEMIGLAKQSKRSPWLIADIEAEKGAMAQAEIANREKIAGIDKTMSETNKNNATATETMQKAGKARMDISRPVYEVLGMSGNINMAKSYLDNARASGAIDDDTYQSHISQLDLWQGLSPEEIKAVSFAMAKGQLDPKYLYQDANNMADNETKLQMNAVDNETSRLNNQNTVRAQMYGHDLDYQKAVDVAGMNNDTERWKTQAGIDHENSQIDAHYQWQQNAVKSGQAKVIEVDGRLALDFGNGQYAPYVGKDGKPATPAPKAESRADKEAREIKIIDLEQSYDQMQQGMDLVDKVSGAFEAIGKGDGLIDNGIFATKSHIPGTNEHALMGHIETLKSNVFLTQVEKMKGLGALTDTEGKKLESAIANLNPYSKDFATSLAEIKATLEQAKQRIGQKQAVYEQADFNNAFF